MEPGRVRGGNDVDGLAIEQRVGAQSPVWLRKSGSPESTPMPAPVPMSSASAWLSAAAASRNVCSRSCSGDGLGLKRGILRASAPRSLPTIHPLPDPQVSEQALRGEDGRRADLARGPARVSRARAMLTGAQARLAGARADLACAPATSADARADLAPARDGLSHPRADLARARDGLSCARARLSRARDSLSHARARSARVSARRSGAFGFEVRGRSPSGASQQWTLTVHGAVTWRWQKPSSGLQPRTGLARNLLLECA